MQNGAPTTALVINTYEQARFLADSIGSALAQSHPFDEIIVVDDGSTDCPDEIVARYPGVRLIRQQNAGLAAARNTGLRATTCRYIVFLDADDLLTASAVACGLRAHSQRPDAALVYGGHRRIGPQGEPLGGSRYDPIGPEPYETLLNRNPIGMHATVMYERAVLLAAGGFDSTLPCCEDYDLYLRLARTHPIASHPVTTALYRWHGGNMSKDPRVMLHWVLQVNERQLVHTAHDKKLEAARRAGRRVWKRYYGEELALSIRQRWRSDRGFTTLRRTVAALSFAPPHAGVALGRAALGRVGKAVGRVTRPRRSTVDLGDLGTPTPISLDFGFDRGTPIDRFYIAGFLDRWREAIRGRALEVADSAYCRRYGGTRITQQDVLHIDDSSPHATIVGDLANPSVLPGEAFDCIVLTQTLHLIYDVSQAVRQLHRALKPGGMLLLTVPGITPLERGTWGDIWYWSFTRVSAQRLFSEVFGADQVEVEAYGNVFAATAFLQGLAVEEVDQANLRFYDPAYPVIVAVAARKSEAD